MLAASWFSSFHVSCLLLGLLEKLTFSQMGEEWTFPNKAMGDQRPCEAGLV